MKYLMILFALLSFAFAIWMATIIRSDIQMILMVQGAIGGCLFIGIAAVLHELENRQ